ncbi:MAG: exopolyphosphatase [Deltaproteobacteria bacterium]|nr:exopolyphosphatase [Deltaproteobacteria bacterium]
MRLVTRADFDGLVCGALATTMEEIDSYLFVEPKFMQDGLVEIREGDIIANLPYHPNCSLWFDHHITSTDSWDRHCGVSGSPTVVAGKGGFRLAPSAARVVYEYYTSVFSRQNSESRLKAAEGLKILTSERFRILLEETDKIDAALLTPDEVLDPRGYVLISMTIDGKRADDEPYWLNLINLLRDASLDEVLRDPQVKRRCQEVLDTQETLRETLLNSATLKGNVIFMDLRGIQDMPEGNRFLLYTLFPSGNISLKVANDSQRPDTIAISVGYNIFNTTSKVNVGALMEKHGGGGHKVVGSCRVPKNEAEKAIGEILEAIKE